MKKAAPFAVLALVSVSLLSCYKGNYIPKPPSGLYERVLASQDVSSLSSSSGLIIINGQTDVRPFVALGLGLKRAGYRVTLATHPDYAPLAALHGLDWESRRAAFGDPLSLIEELQRLDNLIDRPTLDPAVVARGPELRERLRASIPASPRSGCVHGDFQWANILYDENQPIALIDWEIASIGPTLIDLGWVSFFADPASWVEVGEQRVRPLTPDEILATYSAAAAFPVSAEEVRWFRAFAGYRFGVITCFNLMLHRRGKRDDPHWEEIALSAPHMFERGLDLLA